MTQEELDALMSNDLDTLEDEAIQEEESSSNEGTNNKENETQEQDENYGRVEASKAWPPPPPSDDNKVVHQLDDVTKESEEKANEILEEVERLGDFFINTEENLNTIKEIIKANIELFDKLHAKFPNIKSFVEKKKKMKNC